MSPCLNLFLSLPIYSTRLWEPRGGIMLHFIGESQTESDFFFSSLSLGVSLVRPLLSLSHRSGPAAAAAPPCARNDWPRVTPVTRLLHEPSPAQGGAQPPPT